MDFNETTPFSIRLTPKQRAHIRKKAQDMNMSDSAWVRMTLFCDTTQKRVQWLTKANQDKQLARILSLLGQSRIANNLNQLTKAVNTGTLILSPDVIHQIDECYRAIIWMRQTLIEALGLKG